MTNFGRIAFGVAVISALWIGVGCRLEPDPQVLVKQEPGKTPRPVAKPQPDLEPPAGIAIPEFVDIAAAAGIDFRRYDDIRGLHRIIESNGGGVALFDFDSDGWLDVFLTNGCRLAAGTEPVPEREEIHSNEFYRNLGRGSFVKVTNPAGLTSHGYSQGCAVGDYDNDGFDDLYVTAFGRNCFWRNNGDGTFSDVTHETRTGVSVWSSSVAFADFNRDGNLDLYVVNYLQESQQSPKQCENPASPDGYVTCPPTVYRAEDDVLFLADGRGGFRDATVESGVNGVDGKGLGVVVFDADLDSRPDIYVANDGMPNFLYLNSGATGDELKFDEQAAFWGCAINAGGAAEASMGVACGDMDGDGRSDLFITHFYTETNTMYRNGERWFEDVTRSTGLGAASRQLLGFGTEFIDFDNDRWLDLFVTNGHIDDMRWRPGHPPYKMPPQFFVNRGAGSFVDASRWSGDYFAQTWLGRGAAAGDIDNDGDLDLAVSHQLAPAALLRNDTDTSSKSVMLKLIGSAASNRSAIGSRIEVEGFDTSYVREVVGGGSYQSSSDRRVHLGMSEREVIQIRVVWPSGEVSSWQNTPPGSYFAIESSGELIRASLP
jgi:hypothetical protein